MISTTAVRDGQIHNMLDRVWKDNRIPSIWHPWDPTGVREYALTNYFSLHHKKTKRLSFLHYHMPSHWVSFKIHCYKHTCTTSCPSAL